jgi:DNA end-binding protein Ku
VALANYAARGKGYLVLVRPIERGLVMQQLHYADEVRPFTEVPVPENVEVKKGELDLALQLIQQSVSEDFQPEKYEDAVRVRLQEIIQQKVEGQEITIAPSETPKAQVIDLMEALKASLGQTPAAAGKKSASGTGRLPAKASPRKAAKKADEAPKVRRKGAR